MNEETRTESGKRDHHSCFRQVNARTLLNRYRRENDDQDLVPEEMNLLVPSSLPSFWQSPDACNARSIPSSDTDPSQSSAITRQPECVDSSLEGEDQAGKMNVTAWSKDAQLSSQRSSEAISDSEDESTGYLDETGSSRLTCWICYEGDEEDPLVSPCSCSGTMGFVHVSCLEHWRNDQNVNYCDLCGQPFHVAAQPKSMRRFLHYVWQSEGLQRLALLSAIFFLAMITSAIVFSLVKLVAVLGGIQSEGVVWSIVVLVGSAFLAYCLQCSFQIARN